MSAVCAVCGETGSKRCTRCKQVFYCGKDHQVAHWPDHKRKCKKTTHEVVQVSVVAGEPLGARFNHTVPLEIRQMLLEKPSPLHGKVKPGATLLKVDGQGAREMAMAEFKSLMSTPRPEPIVLEFNSPLVAAVKEEGLLLGELRLGKVLGQGRFSTVHEALNVRTGEHKAVKILAKGDVKRLAARHPSIYDELKMEVNVLDKTDHPNLLSLVHSGDDQDTFYRVFEHQQGSIELLEVLLRRHKAMHDGAGQGHPYLTEGQAKHVIAQVINACDHMHSKGIIHRDIKPENMVVTPNGRVVLIDYGTAKDNASGIKVKEFSGTPQYMAPEILLKIPSTKAVDFFSIGCVLYQLLTGTNAFEAGSEYLVFMNVQKGEYPPLGNDVSDEAKDLIVALLTMDPEKRLGAGEADLSVDALRNHPFFADIDFSTVHDRYADLHQQLASSIKVNPSNTLLPPSNNPNAVAPRTPEQELAEALYKGMKADAAQ